MAQLQNTGITGSLNVTTNVSASAFTGSFTGSFAGTHTGTFPYTSLTGVPAGILSSSAQVTNLLPTGTVSSSTQINNYNVFATTGSNAFNANQTITGSLIITQNLTVLGSSSVSFVSQSTLNIGTNLITVNVQNPSVRFGGLAVIDSGSSPQRSGSLLFDSTNDQWIFVHQNVAGGVTSSILVMGPPTFNNVGNETLLTQNRVLKGAGLEHIVDSQITDDGSIVSITNALNVGTSVTASAANITTLRSTTVSASGGISGSGLFVTNDVVGNNFRSATTSYYFNPTTGLFNISNGYIGAIYSPGSVLRVSFSDAASTFSGNVIATSITSSVSGALAGTFPFASLTGIPIGIVSSSGQISYTGLTNIPIGIISSSTQINALSGVSASFATIANQLNGGTTGYIPVWSSATAQSSSALFQNGGNIGIRVTNPDVAAHIGYGTLTTINTSDIRTITALGLSGDDPGTTSANHAVGLTFRPIRGRGAVASIVVFNDGANKEGSGEIAFYNGSGAYPSTVTERMRINGSGNVGIGTSSPDANLTVQGQASFNSGSLSNPGVAARGDLNTGMYFPAADTIGFVEGGVEAMRIDSSGRVGIGTVNPASNLHVSSSNNTTAAIIDVGVRARYQYQANSTSLYTTTFNMTDTGLSIGHDSGIREFQFVTGNSTRMTILGGGNVGIGTTSPSALLHVSASGTTNDFLVGTNKLFVSASGNVGIATTSPGSRLSLGTVDSSTDTANAIRIWEAGGENGNNYGIGMRSSDGRFAYTAGTGGYHEWFTGNTARWRITPTGILQSTGAQTIQTSTGNLTLATTAGSGHILLTPHGTGNVGIGTTAPGATLHVQGAISSSTIRTSTSGNVLANSFTAGFASGARVIDSTSPAFELWHDGNSVGQFLFSSNALRYGVHSGNGVLTERLRIDSSGNVGIGATSLDSLLHLRSASPVLRIDSTNPANNSELKLTYNNNDNHGLLLRYNGNSAVSFIDNTYPATVSQQYGDIQFRQNVSSSLSARMIIKADGGNVGIGTTTPGARLDVVNTAGAVTSRVRSTFSNAYFIIDRQDTSSEGFLRFATNTSNIWTIGLKDSTNTLYFNSGIDRVVIDSSGRVGVGTTTPGTTLHVQGNISASFITGSAIYVSSSLGELLSQTSSSMAVGDIFYDTNITVSSLSSDGPSVYELLAQYNPNLSGSSTYRNILHGHIYIEQGWDGSQLVMSAEYNELYRAIASGSSDGSGANVNVSFVSASGAATAIESITVPFASSSWRMRIRFSNNSVPSAFPSYRYVRLMRKL